MKNILIGKKLLVIILSAVVLFGCEKPEDLGQNIVALPNEKLNIVFTDTLSLTTYSFLIDSIATKQVSKQILGSMADPIFGTTATGIYTQIRMANNDLNFGNNPQLDSIVLSLEYAGFYGKETTPQRLKVYQLDENMYTDSSYFSNRKLATMSNLLFNDEVTFNTTDSVVLPDGKIAPQLRIKLSSDFGNEILSKSGQSELSNNDQFIEYMKGLYIEADKITSEGGFAYFDLLSTYSNVILYYHNDVDTSYESFLINSNCAYYTSTDHFGYADATLDFQNQVVNGDTNLGKQLLYLQPLAGVRTFINFPYLSNLTKDNPIAVQKAELIINLADNSNDDFPAPLNISAVGINQEGQNVYLTDYSEGTSFFGGSYNADNKQYTINITRTIQEMLLGTSTLKGIRLIVTGESVLANRAVINGPQASNNRTRLRLYYTDVK